MDRMANQQGGVVDLLTHLFDELVIGLGFEFAGVFAKLSFVEKALVSEHFPLLDI